MWSGCLGKFWTCSLHDLGDVAESRKPAEVWARPFPSVQMDRRAQVSRKTVQSHGGKGRRLPGGMISRPAFNFLGRRFLPLQETTGAVVTVCACAREGRLQQKKPQPQIPRLAPLILLHLPIGFSFVLSFSFFSQPVSPPRCVVTLTTVPRCGAARRSMCWDHSVKGSVASEIHSSQSFLRSARRRRTTQVYLWARLTNERQRLAFGVVSCLNPSFHPWQFIRYFLSSLSVLHRNFTKNTNHVNLMNECTCVAAGWHWATNLALGRLHRVFSHPMTRSEDAFTWTFSSHCPVRERCSACMSVSLHVVERRKLCFR